MEAPAPIVEDGEVPERPKSPYPQSYSVSVQGSPAPKVSELEAEEVPASVEQTKEEEPAVASEAEVCKIFRIDNEEADRMP